VSPATVKRSIHYWLQHPPEPQQPAVGIRNIVCDGTYLEQRTGVYAIMNAQPASLVYAEYGVPEGARQLTSIFQTLANQDVTPQSATVDGNPQQMKYLRRQWPQIIIQRCIVHVQRQGLSWCRRNPKRTDAKHLRKLFLRLSSINTLLEVERFKASLLAWEERFGIAIEQSKVGGWVFSDLVRARSMIVKALPDLFHYVNNPLIPRSTNQVENYFGRLKDYYRRHRGLATHHRDAYFRWYFKLKNR